jgi:hypothetical protein
VYPFLPIKPSTHSSNYLLIQLKKMFQKGHEKIGGRQKGTQNKTSTEIRKNATIMLQSELDVLKEKLPKKAAKPKR